MQHKSDEPLCNLNAAKKLESGEPLVNYLCARVRAQTCKNGGVFQDTTMKLLHADINAHKMRQRALQKRTSMHMSEKHSNSFARKNGSCLN